MTRIKKLFILFVFLINSSHAAIKPALNPKCVISSKTSKLIAGQPFQFKFEEKIGANRVTAAFKGDKANKVVKILRPGVGEFIAPDTLGKHTFGMIAVNDAKEVYQACSLKVTVISPNVLSSDFESQLLTKQNRYHDDVPNNLGIGPMGGGWGPHTRSILYGEDGSKWFVHEQKLPGDSVLVNPGLEYDRLDPQSGWKKVNTQLVKINTQLGPVVQQNMAHITDGKTIFSYGVNYYKDPHELIECTFDIVTSTPRGCAPVTIGGNVLQFGWSNYVGAAIVPEGKLLWYTSPFERPDSNYGNGSFSYLFNDGTGWKYVKSSALGAYDQLNYVRSANTGLGIQVFGGESEYGGHGYVGPAVSSHFLASRYTAQVGVMRYKTTSGSADPAVFARVKYKGQDVGVTIETQDIYYDKKSKRVHVIVKLFSAPAPDQFDKKGIKSPACVDYEKATDAYKNRTYADLAEHKDELAKLNELGLACIYAVRANQKAEYGYVPTLAYGSATLDDLLKGKAIDVLPQSQLASGGETRFVFDQRKQELYVAMNVNRRLEDKSYAFVIQTFSFPKTALALPLNFDEAWTIAFDLRKVVTGSRKNDLASNALSAIYVPGANYSPEKLLSSDLEIAVCGSSYNKDDDNVRGDGKIYYLKFPNSVRAIDSTAAK